ncbi:hypothetical protein GobsT_48140 [Gemmata obscuriglobus]|uniref:Uncharacterized protein n=1 Tax=Gemmata obscuriglobus TaxID=114 RepID=A0A2Z3GYV9_9BACT|nr:hypothetical protein C1280_09535 [Gemmata obscuriglobus]QEG30014.1 hypothetical protein GobsT_48140 [Gemmata obscuriglobus]VTS09335.1 unnamed protein product [Gemmata obscuriglobus UQM 2246]
MNVFDKVCASLAFVLGAFFLVTGVVGAVLGCRAHFTLPPVVGALPAFVGWGIVRAVYLAWRRRPVRPPDQWPDGFRPLPDRLGTTGQGAGGSAEPGATPDTAR